MGLGRGGKAEMTGTYSRKMKRPRKEGYFLRSSKKNRGKIHRDPRICERSNHRCRTTRRVCYVDHKATVSMLG